MNVLNCFLFLMLVLFAPLFGDGEPFPTHLEKGRSSRGLQTIHIGYLKAGTELGAGYRQHTGLHGFDISVNRAIFFYPNWINVKGLYLHYPLYASHRFFYWGLGAGINYEYKYHLRNDALGGLIRGCPHCHHYRIFPSLEGVVGYEFFTDKKIKIFAQFGVSVPLGDAALAILPAVSLGAGF